MRDLCADMDAGKVDLLLILGGNPVYDAPHDFDFTYKLKRVATSIHLSPYYDETSVYCHWHVAESHFLETWSDARAYDGTASIIQPLIAPLYYTHSAHDLVAAFSDKPGMPAYDAVRAYWTEASTHLATPIDAGWRKWLNDGVIAGTKFAPINPELKFNATSLPVVPARPCGPDRISFSAPTPTVHDGRFANNGWLQELPKPVTKLTWDNAALISPKLAQKLDFAHKIASRGGEHGQVRSTVVDIALNGQQGDRGSLDFAGPGRKLRGAAARLWPHARRIHWLEQGFQRLCRAHFETPCGLRPVAKSRSPATIIRWPARSITSTWKAGRS